MPDIKTALSTALQTWTKDVKEPDVQAARKGFAVTTNVSRALFDYVKAHPGHSRKAVRSAMINAGYSDTSVSSLLGQFLAVGHFRIVGDGVFTDLAAYEPVKASALRAARAAQKKRPEFHYPPAKKKAQQDAPPAPEAEFNPQALVGKLTLPQARELYDLLRRYLTA